MSRRVTNVLYLCDGRACGDECPNPECRHTKVWEHALHKDADVSQFEKVPIGDDRLLLVEPCDAE